MEIRKANINDLPRINEVILRSKRHWGYSEDWMEIFRPELIRDEEVLSRNTMFVLETKGTIAGLYSLSEDEGELEIEDMWVLPEFIGKGYGKALFEHLVATASRTGAQEIRILSDPHAEGFYLRMGAVRVGEQASRIAGRNLPVLKFSLCR